MKINRSLLKRLKTIVSTARKVKVTTQIENFHNETQIGRIIGQHYVADIDRTVDWVKNICGINLLVDNIPQDWQGLVWHGLSEKQSNASVFGDCICFNAHEGQIALKTGMTCLPANSALLSTLDNLDLSNVNHVILVENGRAIRFWQDFQIPNCLKDALAIYRGHQQDAHMLRNWLTSPAIRKKFNLIAAVDYDPAGIKIALDNQADGILIPSSEHKISYSNETVFLQQNDISSNLSARIPKMLQPHWQEMQKERIAITQEAMLLHKLTLELVRL